MTNSRKCWLMSAGANYAGWHRLIFFAKAPPPLFFSQNMVYFMPLWAKISIFHRTWFTLCLSEQKYLFFKVTCQRCIFHGQRFCKVFSYNRKVTSFYSKSPARMAQCRACHSWPGGCEFDIRLRWTFFPAYFRLSPLQKHVRKVVSGFGKKSCVSAGVRKPGNMYVTDCHDMTLAVKVALNPITTNQRMKDCKTFIRTKWCY